MAAVSLHNDITNPPCRASNPNPPAILAHHKERPDWLSYVRSLLLGLLRAGGRDRKATSLQSKKTIRQQSRTSGRIAVAVNVPRPADGHKGCRFLFYPKNDIKYISNAQRCRLENITTESKQRVRACARRRYTLYTLLRVKYLPRCCHHSCFVVRIRVELCHGSHQFAFPAKRGKGDPLPAAGPLLPADPSCPPPPR